MVGVDRLQVLDCVGVVDECVDVVMRGMAMCENNTRGSSEFY
jgi:hypothetical protein